MSLLDAAYEDIAGDGAAFKETPPPGAWQWTTSNVMLMKIFGLNNKSDTKNRYFVVIRNMKCTVIGQAMFHFTCSAKINEKRFSFASVYIKKKMTMLTRILASGVRIIPWTLGSAFLSLFL